MSKALNHLTMMATLALASFNMAGSCGPSGADLCTKDCDCPPRCTGYERLKCALDADQALMRAAESDCEEQYHNDVHCRYDAFTCEEGIPGQNRDCSNESRALSECLSSAAMP